MKQIVLRGWNWFRFLRLVIGVSIVVQAIVIKDSMLAVAGLLFTGMAVFNIDCCGATGCYSTPQANKATEPPRDVVYDEVV
jgi:hypothetical protein